MEGGEQAKLGALVDGGESRLPGGDELLRFAEVALEDDVAAIDAVRSDVVEALGEAAMVDSAAVIANFQRMVRIADGTGIPLDEPVLMLTQDIREDLGINGYGSADNSPPLSLIQKILGRLLQPFLKPVLLRRAAQRAASQGD